MTQAEIKFVRSLLLQKYRKEHNAYLIEGNKIVKEWLASDADILLLIVSKQWLELNQELIPSSLRDNLRVVEPHIIQKLSNLKTTPEVMAVVRMKSVHTHNIQEKGWTIVLDRIQDPGNLGTIIRTADWFGIDEVLVTNGTVEVYNPKVIQSTMGSLLRVRIGSIELLELKNQAIKPIWITALDGISIYDEQFPSENSGYIVFGNESQGVDPEFMRASSNKITIPRIGNAESLNVAIANAVICSELIARRK